MNYQSSIAEKITLIKYFFKVLHNQDAIDLYLYDIIIITNQIK